MKLSSLRIVIYTLLLISFQTKAQEISPYLVGTNLWYTNPKCNRLEFNQTGRFSNHQDWRGRIRQKHACQRNYFKLGEADSGHWRRANCAGFAV
jgi:hypothetical protein